MSRRVFTSAVQLLLVVMMCSGTGMGAAAEDASSGEEPSAEKLFLWRDLNEDEEEKVESLHVPSLVEMDGDVFAVAEAQCKKGDDDVFTGIASQIITKVTDDQQMELLKEALKDAKTKTKVLEKGGSEGNNKKVDVSRPTTVVKGNDIYMLVGNYSGKGATCDAQKSGAVECGLLLVKGNVSTGQSGSEKRIQWNESQRLVGSFSADEHEPLTQLIGGGGSGVKTTGGTLVFPVEAKKKEKEDKENSKTVSLILYSTNTKSWKLSKEIPADGCSNPSVVEWEKDKKLIMMTACDDGRRRVYESGDMGYSWTEALGTLSRVWGNKQGEGVKHVGSGFITATIDGVDNRSVMLVTLPVYVKKDVDGENENPKSELHLWLTDNTHIVDIGSISSEGEDDAASSLLYKSTSGTGNKEENKEELIALYEKKADGETPSSGVVPVSLTAELEEVKKVLKTWKEVDERVSKLCFSSIAAEGTSPENACSTAMPTAGLVGFLSSNFSKNTWMDEYLGVNATVTENGAAGATKTPDGVTFQGAWAEWPIGAQGENQLYHFANYNFTLVATVSIRGQPEGGTTIPVIGVNVKMNGAENTVFFGLSYNNEKKWQLLCGGGTSKELSSPWKPGKTHQLAIVLQNGSQTSAYVDGERVGNEGCELKVAESKGISHFYIGGVAGSAEKQESRGVVPLTVTNVLLYNRPLTFSRGNADVAEVANTPLGNPQPSEGASPSVTGDQK
ncbi:trans-sialidase, putative, partial [Trypanosoma cruzi marinkellei]